MNTINCIENCYRWIHAHLHMVHSSDVPCAQTDDRLCVKKPYVPLGNPFTSSNRRLPSKFMALLFLRSFFMLHEETMSKMVLISCVARVGMEPTCLEWVKRPQKHYFICLKCKITFKWIHNIFSAAIVSQTLFGYIENKLRQFFVLENEITGNRMSIVQLFSLTLFWFFCSEMLLFLLCLVVRDPFEMGHNSNPCRERGRERKSIKCKQKLNEEKTMRTHKRANNSCGSKRIKVNIFIEV